MHQWELGKKKGVCIKTARSAHYITLPNKAQAIILAVINLIVQQTSPNEKDHKCFHMWNPLIIK